MAQGIRVDEGWRRKALLAELEHGAIPTGLTIDNPAFQAAFEIVCRECKDLLPCGSTLAVASGRALEFGAEWGGSELKREEFRLVVRCLRYSGVLQELPGVRSTKNGRLLGVPAEYGALEAYDYTAHEGTLQVDRRGAMRPRLVAQLGVPGGVIRECRSGDPRFTNYHLECEAEVRALYSLGLNTAPALVYAYGPGRCRQVRRWAARRAGKKNSAALVFSTLVKHSPYRSGSAFDAEAIRREMKQEIALDDERRPVHTR